MNVQRSEDRTSEHPSPRAPFARCGVHGATAITAITAQNTVGVAAIHPIPAEIVLEQVRAVVHDIRVDAVKVGMLGTVECTLAVARALDGLPAGTPGPVCHAGRG